MTFLFDIRVNKDKRLMLSCLPVILIVVLAIAGCSTNQTASSQSTQSQSTQSQSTPNTHSGHPASTAPTPRIPSFVANLNEAKPLPGVLDPAQFSDPVVVKAYRYAQKNPELFAQQPCYCYCDTGNGHRSLLDCFASEHSAGCPLCLKEGLLVDKLHKEGKSATEIRESIVRGDWQSVRLD